MDINHRFHSKRIITGHKELLVSYYILPELSASNNAAIHGEGETQPGIKGWHVILLGAWCAEWGWHFYHVSASIWETEEKGEENDYLASLFAVPSISSFLRWLHGRQKRRCMTKDVFYHTYSSSSLSGACQLNLCLIYFALQGPASLSPEVDYISVDSSAMQIF